MTAYAVTYGPQYDNRAEWFDTESDAYERAALMRDIGYPASVVAELVAA